MPEKTRKRFTAQEKVAILWLHLLEHTPVSDLCDQHGIHPTMFYRWQKEFFENASAAFEPRSHRGGDAKDRNIKFHIEARLCLDPAPEVAFDTVLELSTGHYTVQGG